MFGIYSAMRNGFDVINANANKNAFDLYKYSRDNKDELMSQIMVKLRLVFPALIKILFLKLPTSTILKVV